jgi:hypothetical protein
VVNYRFVQNYFYRSQLKQNRSNAKPIFRVLEAIPAVIPKWGFTKT